MTARKLAPPSLWLGLMMVKNGSSYSTASKRVGVTVTVLQKSRSRVPAEEDRRRRHPHRWTEDGPQMVGGTRVWRIVLSSVQTGRAKVEWRPVVGSILSYPRATMTPFFFVEVEERFYVVRGIPAADDYVPPEDTIKVEKKWRPIEQGDLSTVFRYQNTTER